jgi:hypothetical protein
MPSMRSATLACCANVGSRLLLILAYSDIFILLPDMTSKYSLALGCRCAAIVEMSIWTPSSRATGKVPPKSGSMLIYMLNRNGQKHHLLPQDDDKRKEPELTPRLKALIKWVTKLRQPRLKVCHCIKEL